MLNSVDKKALEILLSYNLLAPHSVSDGDFTYAKQAGLLFDLEIQEHDTILRKILLECEKFNKTHTTNLFLSSLSTQSLDWRVGLSTYAIAQSIPQHSFTAFSQQNQFTCTICCSAPQIEVNRSFLNFARFSTGGTAGLHVYDLYFNMQQHNLLANVLPTEKDYRLFIDIMTVFFEAQADEVPAKLDKKIKKIDGFKSSEEQRRSLIETLGYCSVLDTEKYPGFLKRFTNICQAPRKSRSSDWHYPADWWTGKDGINKLAFKHWFGTYPQLEKFWK